VGGVKQDKKWGLRGCVLKGEQGSEKGGIRSRVKKESLCGVRRPAGGRGREQGNSYRLVKRNVRGGGVAKKA